MMEHTNGKPKAEIKSNTETIQEGKETCGIIMPIADSPGYEPGHWISVKKIVEAVIDEAGFIPKMVSDSDDIKIIHTNIVSNIADNPIIVCDVSSRNPNVMFELGLRLAFDKPVVIIKDEDGKTPYSFDISPVKHISYPSGLHFHEINEFRDKLKGAICSTRDESRKKDYSPFLKNFAKIKAKTINEEEAGLLTFFEKKFQEYEIRNVALIKSLMSRLETKTVSSFDSKQKEYQDYNSPIVNEFKDFIKRNSTSTNLTIPPSMLIEEFIKETRKGSPLIASLISESSQLRKIFQDCVLEHQSKF
ncbi:hypothetical protein [Limnovirga soli]|uniref:RNA helicase n=1 Tax=Limnovirga soli TaxID=2656915 RepID=A0A8J8JUN4_9BACT|nr:hypothetical protein [Limnovirga soli]NNV57213.1 hypothetical protein [Limnovirga soli]